MDYISNHNELLQNILYLSEITQGIAVFLGITLMISCIFKLKKMAEQKGGGQGGGMMAPMMMFFSASVLLALPTLISTTLVTFWGTASPLSYNTGTNGLDQMMEPILAFVRLLGVVAFIRGWLMLSKHTGEQSQPGQMSKSLMHIVGGVLCMHVVGSSYLVLNLMGCFT